jgi:hypothetical protein
MASWAAPAAKPPRIPVHIHPCRHRRPPL